MNVRNKVELFLSKQLMEEGVGTRFDVSFIRLDND